MDEKLQGARVFVLVGGGTAVDTVDDKVEGDFLGAAGGDSEG